METVKSERMTVTNSTYSNSTSGWKSTQMCVKKKKVKKKICKYFQNNLVETKYQVMPY